MPIGDHRMCQHHSPLLNRDTSISSSLNPFQVSYCGLMDPSTGSQNAKVSPNKVQWRLRYTPPMS
eukprot:11140000-Ditylum_brightwellii.AAC.1